MDNKINKIIDALIDNPDAVTFWIAEEGPELLTATHIVEHESKEKEEMEINL